MLTSPDVCQERAREVATATPRALKSGQATLEKPLQRTGGQNRSMLLICDFLVAYQSAATGKVVLFGLVACAKGGTRIHNHRMFVAVYSMEAHGGNSTCRHTGAGC